MELHATVRLAVLGPPPMSFAFSLKIGLALAESACQVNVVSQPLPVVSQARPAARPFLLNRWH